jgi:hypothetical protein
MFLLAAVLTAPAAPAPPLAARHFVGVWKQTSHAKDGTLTLRPDGKFTEVYRAHDNEEEITTRGEWWFAADKRMITFHTDRGVPLYTDPMWVWAIEIDEEHPQVILHGIVWCGPLDKKTRCGPVTLRMVRQPAAGGSRTPNR